MRASRMTGMWIALPRFQEFKECHANRKVLLILELSRFGTREYRGVRRQKRLRSNRRIGVFGRRFDDETAWVVDAADGSNRHPSNLQVGMSGRLLSLRIYALRLFQELNLAWRAFSA